MTTEQSSSGLTWMRPVAHHKFTVETNVPGGWPLFELEATTPRDWTLTIRTEHPERKEEHIPSVTEGVAIADRLYELYLLYPPIPESERCAYCRRRAVLDVHRPFRGARITCIEHILEAMSELGLTVVVRLVRKKD